LRDAIVGAVDDPFLDVAGEMESFLGEKGHKIPEECVAPEFGDILHAHDIWLQLSNETAKVPEQGPFRTTVVREALGVFRERLTGCAPDENTRMTLREVTD